MGEITRNFSLREFACRCCGVAHVSLDLVNSLQELRDRLGMPLRVLSGYRCPEHNREVGGAPGSRHVLGEAADITAPIPLLSLYEAALGIPAFQDGGIGLYPRQNFIHLDVRGRIARWGQLNGKHASIDRAVEYLKVSVTRDA